MYCSNHFSLSTSRTNHINLFTVLATQCCARHREQRVDGRPASGKGFQHPISSFACIASGKESPAMNWGIKFCCRLLCSCRFRCSSGRSTRPDVVSCSTGEYALHGPVKSHGLDSLVWKRPAFYCCPVPRFGRRSIRYAPGRRGMARRGDDTPAGTGGRSARRWNRRPDVRPGLRCRWPPTLTFRLPHPVPKICSSCCLAAAWRCADGRCWARPARQGSCTPFTRQKFRILLQ